MKISDNDIKKICSSGIFKSGNTYFREGRVHIRVRSEESLVASVDSDKIYNVHIGFDKNGVISETFCTCPYYQTMGAPCRHVAATLKARQAELENGENSKDDNDRAARLVCAEFEGQGQMKKQMDISFVFNINSGQKNECIYSVGILLDDDSVPEAENFIGAICAKKEYKLSRHRVFNSEKTAFTGCEEHVLAILSEAYQNKTVGYNCYTPHLNSVDFGSYTAKRLLPLMSGVKCKYVINGMPQPNLAVRYEDPDILIDLTATDDCISISVPQCGLALVPDGSWFYYDGDIFVTDSEWRNWYMPIYRALASENRSQIDFRGENSIAFAMNVLPKLRGKQGVAEQGVENIVVDDKPDFDVYFDRYEDGISAVVIASYGKIKLRLPEDAECDGKIIVRDELREKYVLSVFSEFTVDGKTLYLDGNDAVYEFLENGIKKLKGAARIHMSDNFSALRQKAAPKLVQKVRYDEKIDLLEVGFESELPPSEIAGILSAIRNGKKYYRLHSGAFLDIDGELDEYELLGNLDFSFNDLKERKKHLSKYYAMYLAGAAKKGTVGAEDSFCELMESIGKIRADIPKDIDRVLRGYQRDGVNWMKQLAELGYGGILADDMGLGKTLEVIAFVMSERPDLPALVVAPSSLTYNWYSEIKKFAPDASAVIVCGTKEERTRLLESSDNCDFIITSYPLLRRDIDEYLKKNFSFCFIDEAQHIKNPKTLSSKAVKKICASRCFALSGTPVENRLSELWSVFDFVMPGYLMSHQQFAERYEKPIMRGAETAASLLRGKIKPFVLRRMKYEVLSELPERIENTVYAELTPQQKKIYSEYLIAARSEISGTETPGGVRILSLLMRLRQICCHPMLVDKDYDGESGKLELFDELVQTSLDSGHRILVFSQFTSMLKIIRERLAQKNIDSFYLDGTTSSYERIEMAERFNGGEKSVFLVSLKAGGTGLNLIGADTVIHYDPWWNPAVTDQASDRAYRIGQTKAVHIIKLAGRGTIEEQILKLQEKKRSLAEDMIRTNSATLSNLSKEEILELFAETEP